MSAALRYCLPRVPRQGYGLGNEMIPWARAFLAAQLLDARLLPPAFGLNRRAYWRDFRLAPDDWIYNRAIERMLPVVEFSQADYLAHGGGDAVAALRGFAQAQRLHERRAYLLVTEGLWGGYHHVQAAREFVRSTLYASRYAAQNLLRLRERLDPDRITVGMHVRLGDFAAPREPGAYRGAPNLSLPLQWFRNIAQSLSRGLGEQLQLLLITDGTEQQLEPLTGALPCVVTADLPDRDCSDVLALAQADLLVCSTSSYSTLAAFLSDSPYLWYAPNLHQLDGGTYTLDDPARQQQPGSPTQRAAQYWQTLRAGTGRGGPAGESPTGLPARGLAVGPGGELPDGLIESVARWSLYRRWQSDLVRSGLGLAATAAAAERRV